MVKILEIDHSETTQEDLMRTLALTALGGIAAVACPPLPEPIVTDYNGYSVKVFEGGSKKFPATEILVKAQSA